MYNRVCTWRRDGDLLTLRGFEGTSILGKAQLAGDSLALHVITSCASEIEILDLTLIFKETLP